MFRKDTKEHARRSPVRNEPDPRETTTRELKMEERSGRLTRDMTRLRDEIVSAETNRRDLMAGVRRSSDERKDTVSGMAEDFRTARMEMKRQMAASHARYLGNLREYVKALRHGISSDLAGARQAFLGGRT